jgi:hypothetical protein
LPLDLDHPDADLPSLLDVAEMVGTLNSGIGEMGQTATDSDVDLASELLDAAFDTPEPVMRVGGGLTHLSDSDV